jgi:hypothetical protein
LAFVSWVSLEDCIAAGVAPDLVDQAIAEAATRRVVQRAALSELRRAAKARAT